MQKLTTRDNAGTGVIAQGGDHAVMAELEQLCCVGETLRVSPYSYMKRYTEPDPEAAFDSVLCSGATTPLATTVTSTISATRAPISIRTVRWAVARHDRHAQAFNLEEGRG